MSDKDDTLEGVTENLIANMAKSPRTKREPEGALVEEPESEGASKNEFSREIERTLKSTENELLGLIKSDRSPSVQTTWQVARTVVEKFQPVPWFIWRLSNFVLGKPAKIGKVTEGLVLGLRRLLFAAASDETLGKGGKVNQIRNALTVLPSDVIAAVAVMHSICRRMSQAHFERIWRPLLDDAIVRSKIGYFVGRECEEFGPGRGILAGFSGRAGLVVQMNFGESAQAKSALDSLAGGAQIREVGLKFYDCEPLQVSAMLLSACGCGRDAAFGVVRYAASAAEHTVENQEQQRWLAAFTIVEHMRVGKSVDIAEECWIALGFDSRAKRDGLVDATKKILRKGHEWNWLV